MKKLVLFIALVISLMLSLSACKIGGGDNTGDNSGDNSGGNSGDNSGDSSGDVSGNGGVLIFDSNTKLAIINNRISEEYSESRERVMKLRQNIINLSGSYPGICIDTQDIGNMNEIVLGDTNRQITAKAYEVLDARLKREIRNSEDEDAAADDLVGYAVYASGGSVAVVWSDPRLEETAFNFFLENYVISSSLYLKEGYTKTEVLSMSEFLKTREEKIIGEAWLELEAQLPTQYASSIIAAYKRLYSLYDQSMIVWYANLGDPETGGWYHSNSARDNHGFLPDIENTYVMMSFIEATGMAEMRGNDWTNVMPEWWMERMGEWIYNMQDPDTFFYHPQWPKEFIEANGLQSRITRDRGSAKNLLSKLGIKPQYSTYVASGSAVPERLGQGSSVVAASKVVATSGMLSQYESVENFELYLAELERQVLATDTPDSYAGKFYAFGNLFQSTTGYIKGEMVDMLEAFFDKYQNPETGLWDLELGYNSTNGLHKVGSVYNSLGLTMKYTDKMLNSVLEILGWNMETPEHTAGAGVDIYNAWSCFSYIYTNVRKCGGGTEEENEFIVDGYKMKVFSQLATLIDKTFNQMAGFRRDDGSYGYSRYGSSRTAQGCPAALTGVHEGDANGNAIASYDIIHYIAASVELEDYMVPMFTEEDCNVFLNIVENLGSVIKKEQSVDEALFFDFTGTDVGACPDDMTAAVDSGRVQNPGSYAHVVEDENGNKVFEYVGTVREVDSGRNFGVTFTVPNLSPNSNVVVLDMDIRFIAADCDVNSQLIQYNVQGSGSPVLYPTFRLNKSGEIWLYNSGGEALTILGMADEWIDFRLEYFWEEGVYKVYVDGVCRASGTDTYNQRAHQEIQTVGLSTPSGTNSHFQIDNVNYSKQNKKYIEASREVLEEKVYTFNTNQLPADFTVDGADDSYTLESMGEGKGFALKTQSALFTVPSYLRTYFGNADVFEFDITVPDAQRPGTDTIVSSVLLKNAKGNALWTVDIGVDANGKLYFANNDSFAEKVSLGVSAANTNTIRLVAFAKAGVGKCDNLLVAYVNGSDTPICYTITMSGKPEAKFDIKTATFGLTDNTLDVIYDNVRLERNNAKYQSPIEYPTVTPGDDAPTLNFEDYNIGTIPERVSGGASVGIELDGSNRFLQIVDDISGNSSDGSKEVLIDLYKTSNKLNSSIIEFDIELLTGNAAGDTILFSLVDSKGKSEDIFKIGHVSYSNTLAFRPYTAMTYSDDLASSGLWSWSHNYSNLDGSPNVISRENLLSGAVATGTPASKTQITLEIDWANQLVYVYYNRDVNKFHKDNGGPGVYKMSLKNVESLKITTGAKATSVITIDNLRAESFYSTPATANQNPDHSFNGSGSSAINGYISNGVQVKPGNGSVHYGAGADGYLDVKGGSVGTNPAITIPVYTEQGTVANKTVFELEIEADKLFSSDSLQIQLMNGMDAVTGISLREIDGKIKMYHQDGKFTSIVRYVYGAGSFTGNVIPLVTTEQYNSLDAAEREGLVTKFTIVIEYSYATGLMTVSFKGVDTAMTPVYSALVSPVTGISAVNLMIPSGYNADVNLYSAYAANVYDPSITENVSFSPTIKDMQGDYEEVLNEWECTHGSHTGEAHQSATNIIFEDGLAVEFAAPPDVANSHHATAQVVTEPNGNRYVEINVPKRLSDRDRGYSARMNVETCSTASNVFMFGGSFYFDSASTYKSFLQIVLYNKSNQYIQLQMDNNASVVALQGVVLGDWDKWLNIRLEYYVDEGLIQVYESDNYKGVITTVSATSNKNGKDVAYIGDNVVSASFSGVNSNKAGYVMRLDNMFFCSTYKEYKEGVISAVVEDFESKYTVDNSGLAPNLSFSSGATVNYDSTKANDAGSYAEVLEENGNHYVHLVAKNRANDNDRGYSIVTNLQNIAPGKSVYVYESRLRFDSWSTNGNISQLIIRSASSWGQWSVDNTKEYVGFGGVKFANWDEWFTLRFEIYTEEGEIHVYAKPDGAEEFSFRGVITTFKDTPAANADKSVGFLTDVVSVGISAYNGNGDAILDVDDMVLYNANLEYADKSDAIIDELPAPSLKDPKPEYTVSFEANGSVIKSETVDSATPTVEAPAAPGKAGYIFDGWYLDKDVWSVPYTADYFVSNPLTESVTIYAKYVEAPKFTVSFTVDGEVYHSESVEANATIALPAAPAKDGYVFDGWYLDEECTHKLNVNAYVNNPLTEDLIVYAKFIEVIPPEVTPDDSEPGYGDEIPGADDIVVPDEGDFGDWLE